MKYLIITNPISGKKKSMKILNEQVIPYFQNQKIDFESFITDYPSHAKEKVHQCKLNEIDNIIVLGGDGTMHEVINVRNKSTMNRGHEEGDIYPARYYNQYTFGNDNIYEAVCRYHYLE